MKMKLREGQLVITRPLKPAKRSASGKTLLVAGTHGVKRSGVRVDGSDVWIVANAFVYPQDDAQAINKKTKSDEHLGRGRKELG